MSNCEFSVIKYVHDIEKFEPVNIGIIMIDKETKLLYRKYITNFEGMYKRLGVKRLDGLKKSLKGRKAVKKVDCQDTLHVMHGSIVGHTIHSKPVWIKSTNVDKTIQRLFNKMISVKEIKR